MGNLSNVSGKEAIRIFQSLGWTLHRQRGSHIILVRDGAKTHLSVPNHKELGPGLLRSLIRDAAITVDDFLALL